MVNININSYAKNTATSFQNNVLKKSLQKSTNINKSSIGDKTGTGTHSSSNAINAKMKFLITKLNITEESESQIQNGMSFLQQKEQYLDTIKATSEKLKQLSEQYKSPDLTEKDKDAIEGQAEKLLKGIDHLMNGKISEQNSPIDFKAIPIKNVDEKTSVILSMPFNITLDLDKSDNTNLISTTKKDDFDGVHFKNKVSTNVLLENMQIIDEKMLTPVQNVIKDIKDVKSNIYYTFNDEYWSAKFSINKLFNSGAISDYIKDVKMRFQESLSLSISALCFQSSNINKDNVCELLK